MKKIILLLLFTTNSFAIDSIRPSSIMPLMDRKPIAIARGERGGNGGDPCEKRISEVRDDLVDWIKRGGSNELVLPVDISLMRYNLAMENALSKAIVSCTESVVKIGEAEKTCKNFVDLNGARQIECNLGRFMAASESDQYVLVHHEYAGAAGLERNRGEASDYHISKQLNGFLRDTVVKRLAIHLTQVLPSLSNHEFTVKYLPTEYRATKGNRVWYDLANYESGKYRFATLSCGVDSSLQYRNSHGKHVADFEFSSIEECKRAAHLAVEATDNCTLDIKFDSENKTVSHFQLSCAPNGPLPLQELATIYRNTDSNAGGLNYQLDYDRTSLLEPYLIASFECGSIETSLIRYMDKRIMIPEEFKFTSQAECYRLERLSYNSKKDYCPLAMTLNRATHQVESGQLNCNVYE